MELAHRLMHPKACCAGEWTWSGGSHGFSGLCHPCHPALRQSPALLWGPLGVGVGGGGPAGLTSSSSFLVELAVGSRRRAFLLIGLINASPRPGSLLLLVCVVGLRILWLRFNWKR